MITEHSARVVMMVAALMLALSMLTTRGLLVA